MKTQELKDLFKDAQSASDVIEIFNSNPGLEDEILELGKNQGVDLNGTKELSEFELELVAGGLTLKQGVVTTMATLMVAGSIIGPLGMTTKAHAAENPDAAGIEQVADEVNLGAASATSSTNSQADQTAEVQKMISDSEAQLSKDAGDKTTVNTKSEISTHSEKASYEATEYNPKMENETKSANVGNIFLDLLKEGGSGGIKEYCKAIPSDLVGSVIGGAGTSLFKSLFNLGVSTKEDAKTRNLLRENTQKLLEESEQSTKAIMQNANDNTFQILTTMDDNFKTTDNKIDLLTYGEGLKKLDSLQLGIQEIINQPSLTKSLDIICSGDQYNYELQKDYIDKAFALAYNAEDLTNNSIVYNFKSISDIITGESIVSKNKNFMDLKKMELNSDKGYVFDDQSLDERREYLTKVAKIYLGQYVQVHNIIDYEYTRNTQNYIQEYIERDAAVQNVPKEEYANMNFEQFEAKYYRSNYVDDQGREKESIDSKYKIKIDNAKSALNKIEDLYIDVLNQFKIEFAKLDYESSEANKGIYVADNKAYTLENVVDSDSYNFTLDSGDGNTCNANDDLETVCNLCGKDSNWYGAIVNSFNVGSHDAIPWTDEYSQTAAEVHRDNLLDANGHLTDMAKKLVVRCNPNAAKDATTIDANVASKLIKYYSAQAENDKTMTQIDGIFTYEDELSQTSLESFHREFEYKVLWGLWTRSYGCDASKGFKLTKQLHYIDKDSGAKGKTVESSRRLDFKNDSNTVVSTGNSKKLGVFKDVSKNYFDGLNEAINAALGTTAGDDAK